MTNLFSKPNYAEDEVELAKESRQQFKLSEKMWKPVPDIENMIRILPARGGSGASYHMKIGKHFVEHPDRTESFICMRETYGKECPACEAYFRIREEADKKAAMPYYPKLYGVFNIINRAEEKPKVKLYEAPRTMVWKKIIFINKGSIKVIDEFDEEGKYINHGRDVIILFSPKAELHNMYVVYPGDKAALGTTKEIEAWHGDIIDLVPEQIALYAPIDYEVAKIKAFGSTEEREELREKLQKKYEASKVKQEDESEQEKAEESEEKEEKKEEEKPEKSEKPEEDDTIAKMEKELAKAKAIKNAKAIDKKKMDHEMGKDEEEKEEPKPKPVEEEVEEEVEKEKVEDPKKSEAELEDKIASIREQIKQKKSKK